MRRVLVTLFAAAVIGCVGVAAGAGSARANGQPSCPIDDSGNCVTSSCPTTDTSCIDNGYDTIEGDGTWSTTYDAYTAGGSTCQYAGAHRARHAPIGHLWTMYFQVYYCWNGSRVTRITPVGPWGQNFIGWPWYYTYSVNWSVPTPPQVVNTGTYAYAFTQMSFNTCFIGRPLCAPTISPWIEIVVYFNGSAVCYSDVDYIGNCRGVKYR